MNAHAFSERHSTASRIGGILAWLGGGHWVELGERYERSTHAVAGAVVLFGAALAWLVAALAVTESAHWSMVAVLAVTLVFALLVGAVTRGTAAGPDRGRVGIAGRAAVAVAIGVVVGELAALSVFSGSIDRRLDEQALRIADSTPAVAQASASLQQTRDARSGLDNAVAQARENQDKALIVARCEYNPTPACPQTRITGVPGAGPETRTANDLLADAQRELAAALTTRDRQVPELDAKISRQEQTLTEARRSVLADADRGLGARWVAMNDVALASPGALTLRLLTIAFFVLVYLLPLILRRWRGETTHDRHATAHTERERAELDADTAIAVKRAEVRREAEIMWAEHQLTQARLAIEAQTEIDREQQRRRVTAALELQSPVRAQSRRTFKAAEVEDVYLPIAAEAEAASRAITHSPADQPDARAQTPQNLPAHVEPHGEVVEPHDDERATPPSPSIPGATRAAARWIRPLVPPFVARVIDTSTQPLRTARQVFEEVEEIAFSLKRTRRVTIDSEGSEARNQAPRHGTSTDFEYDASHERPAGEPYHQVGRHAQHSSFPLPAKDADELSLAEGDRRRELVEREGPRELRSPEGPRQLPPAK